MDQEFKYTKFGKHLIVYYGDRKEVWNYIAQDEDLKSCIELRMVSSYKTDQPVIIDVRSGDSFNLTSAISSLEFVPITEDEFWAAYKDALIKQGEFYLKHTNPEKWLDRKSQLQKAV